MQLGRKILNLRCDRKISQQDLAKSCGITPSALSKIEAGINSPRANVIWQIAKNLGVTIEYLLDEEIPYPYAPYLYRQSLLAEKTDPAALLRMEVSREEKAFVDALRKSNDIARDVAFSIPEQPVETLRLAHFLVHHAKVQNPSQAFLRSFETLVTGASAPAAPAPAAVVPPGTRKRGRPKVGVVRAKRG